MLNRFGGFFTSVDISALRWIGCIMTAMGIRAMEVRSL